MIKNPIYGVEAVFTKAEAKTGTPSGRQFEYIMEGGTGTAFGNAVSGQVIVKPDNSDYKFSVSSMAIFPQRSSAYLFYERTRCKGGAVMERQRIIDKHRHLRTCLGFPWKRPRGGVWKELLLKTVKQSLKKVDDMNMRKTVKIP